MTPTCMKRNVVILLFIVLSASLSQLRSQEEDSSLLLYDLDLLETVGQRIALEESLTTFSMPVSALKYEPLVDVQSRNSVESQGDVTIRGGIFENTGFMVGSATLFDPQTGHYFAEILYHRKCYPPPKYLPVERTRLPDSTLLQGVFVTD